MIGTNWYLFLINNCFVSNYKIASSIKVFKYKYVPAESQIICLHRLLQMVRKYIFYACLFGFLLP